jgi:hypothetical protein
MRRGRPLSTAVAAGVAAVSFGLAYSCTGRRTPAAWGMQIPRPHWPRALVTVALSLAVSLWIATSAHADEHPQISGIAVAHDDGTVRQAIDISGLYPTVSRYVVFFVEGRDRATARRLQLRVDALVDEENGCNRPESATGDTSCADDKGELSQYLSLAVAPGVEIQTDGSRSCEPLEGRAVTTTLRDLRDEPVVVGLPDDEGVLCVVATFTHDERPGDNVTQSDSTTFDLLLAFDGESVLPGGEDVPSDAGHGPDQATNRGTEVLGTKIPASVTPTSVVHGGGLDLGLSRTGAPIGLLLAGGGMLLGAGSLVLLATARRSDATKGQGR